MDKFDKFLLLLLVVSSSIVLIGQNTRVSVSPWLMSWSFTVAVSLLIVYFIVFLKWILHYFKWYRNYVEKPGIRLREKYFNFWRKRTPDWLYKEYLRNGTMDADTYRQYQELGFIQDELDPCYISMDIPQENVNEN